MTKRINLQDRKEEAFDCLPNADQIPVDKVFGKGEGTAQVLMRLTGMSNKTALHNLDRLKAEGRTHIHTWTRTKCPSPVWVKGPGEDAPLPPKTTHAEAMARYRRKLAIDREKRMQGGTAVDSRERTAQTIERARQQKRDPFASLFDPATGLS